MARPRLRNRLLPGLAAGLLTSALTLALTLGLTGCGNGLEVTGPTATPSESQVSGVATASDAPTDGASPQATPSSGTTADQSAGDDGTHNKKKKKHKHSSGGSGGNTGGSSGGSGGTGDSGTGSGSGGSGSGGSGTGSGTGDSGDSGDTGSGQTGSGGSDDGGSTGPGDTGDSGSTSTSSPRAADDTCTLGDLSVKARVPEGGGAAGSVYLLLTFTNTSGTPCWMYGYAGVSFVGFQNGTQVGHAAVRDRSQQPQPVKLSDGETQTELLQVADAGNWDPEECAPTTADGFRIYPPSSYTAAYVPYKIDACQTKSVHQLTVYPVGTKG